jgi:hypothetical protein
MEPPIPGDTQGIGGTTPVSSEHTVWAQRTNHYFAYFVGTQLTTIIIENTRVELIISSPGATDFRTSLRSAGHIND